MFQSCGKQGSLYRKRCRADPYKNTGHGKEIVVSLYFNGRSVDYKYIAPTVHV